MLVRAVNSSSLLSLGSSIDSSFHADPTLLAPEPFYCSSHPLLHLTTIYLTSACMYANSRGSRTSCPDRKFNIGTRPLCLLPCYALTQASAASW